jgi:hypothetical protein
MNVEKIKRLTSNKKFKNMNVEAKAKLVSTRKTKSIKNNDLDFEKINNKKDFSKSKSQFNKYY